MTRTVLRRSVKIRPAVVLRSVLVAFAAFVAALLLVPAGSASATIGSDDYIYRTSSPDQVDQWNFYTRECTSFVAWRLNNDNGVPFNNSYGGQHWGNAENWDSAARAAGFAVDSNPTRGSVAQFDPGVGGVGAYGHVAYVMQVSGSQVLIEDYNWVSFAYDQHWVSTSGLHFLHVGNPGSGGVTGTVHSGGVSLNIRSTPSVSGSVVGSLADGQVFTIQCQTNGDSVTGTYGTTTLWDRLAPGQYVSDAYVYTGSDGQVAPNC